MNSEHKAAIWIVLILAMTLIISLTVSFVTWNQRIRYYTENGYTRTTLPGAANVYWVRDPNGK